MPLTAAKAFFQVHAGVIPGQPMQEHSKRWGYTSEEFEKDRLVPQNEPTIFSKRLQEVHNYAMGLSNPAYVNWVQVDWVWV